MYDSDLMLRGAENIACSCLTWEAVGVKVNLSGQDQWVTFARCGSILSSSEESLLWWRRSQEIYGTLRGCARENIKRLHGSNCSTTHTLNTARWRHCSMSSYCSGFIRTRFTRNHSGRHIRNSIDQVRCQALRVKAWIQVIEGGEAESKTLEGTVGQGVMTRVLGILDQLHNDGGRWFSGLYGTYWGMGRSDVNWDDYHLWDMDLNGLELSIFVHCSTHDRVVSWDVTLSLTGYGGIFSGSLEVGNTLRRGEWSGDERYTVDELGSGKRRCVWCGNICCLVHVTEGRWDGGEEEHLVHINGEHLHSGTEELGNTGVSRSFEGLTGIRVEGGVTLCNYRQEVEEGGWRGHNRVCGTHWPSEEDECDWSGVKLSSEGMKIFDELEGGYGDG
ncbi:hypothetical protein Tco_0708563 [Tanacetum coccineum]